ncbi:hypothetical protein BG015_006411 [Linnemannia schmuckeri]|uniref:Uncharacterized protein n=1 Tax=Linnemannia schmuckeri TaxID=64567 RepID=A0A9P5S3A7_9FUNG|nr:hypothetical protein BG015_006411 [Linnemannia schmuckeri]
METTYTPTPTRLHAPDQPGEVKLPNTTGQGPRCDFFRKNSLAPRNGSSITAGPWQIASLPDPICPSALSLVGYGLTNNPEESLKLAFPKLTFSYSTSVGL